MRANDGAWIGWPGGTDTRPRAVRRRRPDAGAGAAERAGDRGVLRGLLQRHPVAALPRRRRQAGVPPRVVGRLRRGQPALRRAGRRGGRRGRHRVGAGLPAAAGAADAARAAPRPAHRLLPAHPVPAGRAVPAAALAPPDPRGAARRRPGRLPARRRRGQLRPAGAPAGRPQDPPRHRSTCPTAGPCGRRRSRSPSTPRASRSWPASEAVAARAAGDPRGARQPAHGASSASTGSTTPRASTPGCARSASWSRDGELDVEDAVFVQVATPSRERVEQYRILRDDIDRLVGRINGDFGRDRHARRSPTCTPPTRARRWPRSTGPPTSWS